ncbi:extracellular solute-binding protein [Paenibacillus sp. FSL W8-1187]|uniref:Sugar ABC transporter sugar-binding protein n=1 Tax=Paenibacillus pasadenensis TaxID=217090 RepID=A0A2N5N4B8_9BACL|nr:MULTISPECIES: extracellular solute-binding protein [Paenibacillus]PLT45194.1 Sugar ABC transporter sugar-binding protein [Paenibacillus pasadenensis]QGG55584.1 extracellular solute-binding protein [Paenibacillus sp. B01]
MTFTVKKTAAGAMAIAMSLAVLAGCGGNNGNSGNTGEAANEPATNSATNAAAENTSATGGETKLSGDFTVQYFVGGYGDKWWKQVIADFKAANPDLNIKEEAGPQINTQNKPKWIAGTPPDFVYIDGPELNDRQMAEDGQLEDLTDWLQTATNVDGVKILDLLAQQPPQYGGKTYNVPLVLNSWGIFYNKALFEKNGWTEPKDWDTFISSSEAIKAAGTTPFIHTGKYPYYINSSFLFPAIVSANGNDYKLLQDMGDSKVEAFKSPQVLEALGKIVELRDKGFIDKASVSINHTDSQMLFLQNKDAYIPNGLWLPNEMSKDVPADFKFGFIPSVTQKAGDKVVANTSTSTVAIAKNAKNKEAAKAFLQFIFSESQASKFAELSGAPSNIKGDISSSAAPDFVKQAAAYLTADTTVVVPTVTFNQDVDKAMQDATVALTIGKIDPQGWVDRVVKVVEKVAK